MNPLRQRMLADMQLRGRAPRTQESYSRAVQQLAKPDGQSPDRSTTAELRQDFLSRPNAKHAARTTATQARCAITFCYATTLQWDWPILEFIRPPKEHTLPVVLRPDAVWRILTQIRLPHDRGCFSSSDAGGLRLLEGVQLQVVQLDRPRLQLHSQGGTGHTDRYVPLPPRTRTLLRAHWLTQRTPVWLFPAGGPAGCARASARAPLGARGVQPAFHAAVPELGLTKPASGHPLRHAWATQLRESGVNVRLIQIWLGHRSPRSTAIDTPLTRKAELLASAALEQLTAGMP